jgi:hypothetical protein
VSPEGAEVLAQWLRGLVDQVAAHNHRQQGQLQVEQQEEEPEQGQEQGAGNFRLPVQVPKLGQEGIREALPVE